MAVEMKYNYQETTAAIANFNQKDINALREWTQGLDKSKCVPRDLTDQQLVLFYNACGGDTEKSHRCLEKYYSYRHAAPEFFTDRRVDADDVKDSVEALEFAVLPEQTPEGYDIIFHRLHYTEPSKYNLDAGIKLLLMTIDECMYSRGPQAGVVFLFDMRGVKLTHLTRLSVGSLRKFFSYVQEALPMRMKAIHVMNSVSFLDKLIAVLRPFMDKKLFEMIKFHTSTEDLTEFYASMPRSVLPPDYEGTLADTRTLHAENTRRLRDMHAYFKQEEGQREAAAPHSPRHAFKQLQID